MPGKLGLFVSAGPDLEREREHIGQAVARLPISLGWSIEYTPGVGEARGVDPQPIVGAHFYVILLSRDITAPVGWELAVARRAGKEIIGFARDVGRTPAAAVFAREADVVWTPYQTPAELGRLVQRLLAERMVQNPAAYGVPLPEWEALSAFLQELSRESAAEMASSERGAGARGVILSPEEAATRGGVPIKPRGERPA